MGRENELAAVTALLHGHRVVSTVGPGPGGRGKTRLAHAVGAAAEQRSVLILDNCEQVLTGAAELVSALVSLTHDLRILVTSRAPLGVSSEAVHQLPALGPESAAELFARRPARCGRRSNCRTPRSRNCAPPWTVCRWRWSWRPPGCG
ncbi:hypothetical protein ACIRRA_07700 [Nocardia sp. NPDC101769]|uniref:hypothetical protein n=1 Tax=Nocardia sp. NPDC101769 TaxID=3364333 RepID=UPI0037F4C87D